MSFLYFLEGIRTSFLDTFFSLVTHLGEETVFLVLAILFFWCINKREGYYILLVGLFGTVINQALKLVFKIPRPWVLDPDFTIVESARAEATGYSFPSGHTQNIAGTFGAIALYNRRKWVYAVCLSIIVLVAFSRMYLGVHTPKDVLVSLGVALALTLLLRPVFADENKLTKFMPFIVIAGVVMSLGLLLFVLLLPTEGVDPVNLASGLKNACTLLGCTAGLVLVYFVDFRFIHFKTEGVWYSQAIKLVVGLLVVLGIKAGLSSPLTALFGNEYVARSVRYFLIVAFAGAVWPLTFNFFAGLRIGFMDKLTDKVVSIFRKDKRKTEE